MRQVPCKDCAEREYLCHSVCEKYKQWHKQHKIEKEYQKKMKHRDKRVRNSQMKDLYNIENIWKSPKK